MFAFAISPLRLGSQTPLQAYARRYSQPSRRSQVQALPGLMPLLMDGNPHTDPQNMAFPPRGRRLTHPTLAFPTKISRASLGISRSRKAGLALSQASSSDFWLSSDLHKLYRLEHKHPSAGSPLQCRQAGTFNLMLYIVFHFELLHMR